MQSTPTIHEPCDACGDPQCPDLHLCDVAIPSYPCPDARNVADALIETTPVAILRDQAAAKFFELRWSTKTRWDRQAPLETMVHSGLSFAEVAIRVGLPLGEVVAHFIHEDEDARPWLACEADLRDGGAVSESGLARKHGLTRDQVRRLTQVVGVSPTSTTNLRRGGGTKWTAEQIAEAHRLKVEGVPLPQIARTLGLVAQDADRVKASNAAHGLLKRHPLAVAS